MPNQQGSDIIKSWPEESREAAQLGATGHSRITSWFVVTGTAANAT